VNIGGCTRRKEHTWVSVKVTFQAPMTSYSMPTGEPTMIWTTSGWMYGSPNGTHVLGEGVTPREAVDLIEEWLRKNGQR